MTMQEVRAAYRDLRDRCLAKKPYQTTYINALWSDWDLRLAGEPQDVELDPGIAVLTRAQAESQDVLEWLDAYPDAVVDRLPGGLFNPVTV